MEAFPKHAEGQRGTCLSCDTSLDLGQAGPLKAEAACGWHEGCVVAELSRTGHRSALNGSRAEASLLSCWTSRSRACPSQRSHDKFRSSQSSSLFTKGLKHSG